MKIVIVENVIKGGLLVFISHARSVVVKRPGEILEDRGPRTE